MQTPTSSASIVVRTLLAGFFLLAWLCSACTGNVEQAPPSDTVPSPVAVKPSPVAGNPAAEKSDHDGVKAVTAPVSCEVMTTTTDGDNIWFFAEAPASNPVPGDCRDLGNGWYECTPDACLVLPYVGTCAHCGGGGE